MQARLEVIGSLKLGSSTSQPTAASSTHGPRPPIGFADRRLVPIADPTPLAGRRAPAARPSRPARYKPSAKRSPPPMRHRLLRRAMPLPPPPPPRTPGVAGGRLFSSLPPPPPLQSRRYRPLFLPCVSSLILWLF